VYCIVCVTNILSIESCTVESFPRTSAISASAALTQTSAYAVKPGIVFCAVSPASLLLVLPTHRVTSGWVDQCFICKWLTCLQTVINSSSNQAWQNNMIYSNCKAHDAGLLFGKSGWVSGCLENSCSSSLEWLDGHNEDQLALDRPLWRLLAANGATVMTYQGLASH